MGKASANKGKGKLAETGPAKKGKKCKTVSVNELSKISKSKKVQSRKGKGKGRGKLAVARAKDNPIKQSYPRGKTRAELVEWRGPKKRTNSTGLFGSTPPPMPKRIDISNGVLMHNKAKKTLLGIVRGFWPAGAYTWTDINDKYPNWVEKKVIEEFYKFYRHLRGQSRTESKRTIAGHVKGLIKRTVHEEKVRVFQKAKELGKSYLDLKPSYFSDPVWEGMVERWNTEDHMLRSQAGVENRKKVTNLHSSGAKSFQEVEKNLTDEKNGVPPTRLEVWDKTHTRKEVDENGQQVYTTEAAKEIALRYAKILQDKNFNPSQTEKVAEPFQWWLMATEPDSEKPKKGRFIGYPRIPPRVLIKDLAVQYVEEANRAETSVAGAARNRGARNSGNIPSQIFSDVVGGVISILKANPSTYQRELDEKEVENLARAALDLGDPGNRTQFSEFISKEVLYLVADLVDDMFKRYQAKAEEVMGDTSDEDDVTDLSDDEDDVEADGEGQAAIEGEDVEGDTGESEGERDAGQSEGDVSCEGSDGEVD